MTTFIGEEQECISCFVKFGVPTGFTDRRREDCKSFWCPNGHSMSYPKGESEKDKLRRERDRLAQQIAQRDDEIKRQQDLRRAAEKREIAAKGQITRLKKRASEGICPCCNSVFKELQKHMAQKHPEFVAEAAGPALMLPAPQKMN